MGPRSAPVRIVTRTSPHPRRRSIRKAWTRFGQRSPTPLAEPFRWALMSSRCTLHTATFSRVFSHRSRTIARIPTADRWRIACDSRWRFFDAMRDAMADEVPLLVRFSGTDWRDDLDGWSTDDSVAFARELEVRGCDGVDVSSGGNAKAEIPVAPGFQVPFAAAVKRGVESMPVIAVGELDDPKLAEDVLARGDAGRDCDWPRNAPQPPMGVGCGQGLGRSVGVRGSVRMVRWRVTGVESTQNTSSPMAIQTAATSITKRGVTHDVPGPDAGDRQQRKRPEGLQHVGQLVAVGHAHHHLADRDARVDPGDQRDRSLHRPLPAARRHEDVHDRRAGGGEEGKRRGRARGDGGFRETARADHSPPSSPSRPRRAGTGR